MRVVFEEVSVRATKRWVDDGKKHQQTRKFSQTISPFNKRADGSQKNREQITAEITAQRDNWLKREETNGEVVE
jgi:hypothetical protein